MAPGRRMFEHAGDKKFLEIWAEGREVYTRFGKQGSKGQIKLKAVADTAAAMAAIVATKLKEGYVQTGGDVDRGPALDGKQLERHLKNLTGADDDPGYLVLADWLQQQDHPWGELIALQHGAATQPKQAAKLTRQADAHLARNAPAILGARASAMRDHYTWKNGFVKRAVVGFDGEDKAAGKRAISALLALPSARQLDALVLAPARETFTTFRSWDRSDGNLLDPWGGDSGLAALAKAIPERIAHVGFGAWPGTAASAYTTMPSFAHVSAAFPWLTHLELAGHCGAKPGKLALPKLVELAVRFAHADAPQLSALAKAKLPKLERLTVWIGGESNVLVDDVYSPKDYDEDDEDAERYPSTYSASDLAKMGSWGSAPDIERTVDDASITAFLADKAWDRVTHLGIGVPYAMSGELATAIARGPIVKHATTLDLSHGRLGDEAIGALIAAKKSLAHLASIDVRGTQIDKKVAKKLAAALPNALVDTGGEEPIDYHFRCVATME